MEPIAIPEIQLLIASYLSHNDLAKSLTLSKVWKDALLPHLYDSVQWCGANNSSSTGRRLRQKDTPPPVSIEALKTNGHLVRRIVVEQFNDLDLLTDTCPNVQDLALPLWAYHGSTLEQFFRAHPSITSLSMLISRDEMVGPLFRALPNLKKLVATYRYTSSPDDVIFSVLQHCQHLETLDMDLFYLGGNDRGSSSHSGYSSDLCGTRLNANLALKECRMTYCRDSPSQAMDCLLNVLLRSPHLVSAKLPRFATNQLSLLCRAFQENCPSITSLDLSALSKYYSDDNFATIFSVFRRNQLRSIILNSCTLGIKTLDTILGQFTDSIEVLKLEYARGVLPSEWIQRVLSQCRQLRHISTESHVDRQGMLSRVDILRSPWVCFHLEVFRVPIIHVCAKVGCSHLYSSDESASSLSQGQGSACYSARVYSQLAKMTQLREVSMANEDTPRWPDAEDVTLDWSLAGGLDKLAPLVHLEELRVLIQSQKIGQAEMAWMKIHWPKLRVLRGVYLEMMVWAQEYWPELDT
ncbi:hypothetical protein BGZ73_003782 [Actinomortierella ambigua]|nr:hypothetical protein BGZ73_003782 [Actinomortierella ambigua]